MANVLANRTGAQLCSYLVEANMCSIIEQIICSESRLAVLAKLLPLLPLLPSSAETGLNVKKL